MRNIAVLCFILVAGPRLAPSSSTLVVAAASSRSVGGLGGIGSSSPSACRCAPDQFEVVLRTVEREIDLHAGPGPDDTAAMADPEFEDYESAFAAAAAGREGDGISSQLLQPGVATAESESTTSLYYDFTNGLLATIEHGEQIKTIVNHATVRIRLLLLLFFGEGKMAALYQLAHFIDCVRIVNQAVCNVFKPG
jgi:hypothetical protein